MWIWREHDLFELNPFFLLWPASYSKAETRLGGFFHNFPPQKPYFVTHINSYNRPVIKFDFVASKNALEYAFTFFEAQLARDFYYILPLAKSVNSVEGSGQRSLKVNINLKWLSEAFNQLPSDKEIGVAWVDNENPPPWERGKVWFYRPKDNENRLFIEDFNNASKFSSKARRDLFVPLDYWQVVGVTATSMWTELALTDYGTSNDRKIPAQTIIYLVAPSAFLGGKMRAKKEGLLWRFSLTIEFFP